MLQEEPDVTREERAAIVEYLAANFRPGGKIYINRAAAQDLEAALEISASMPKLWFGIDGRRGTSRASRT